MSLCKYCTCHGSWDCEDRNYYPDNCSDFKLDYNMLSKKQKKKIKEILSKGENNVSKLL